LIQVSGLNHRLPQMRAVVVLNLTGLRDLSGLVAYTNLPPIHLRNLRFRVVNLCQLSFLLLVWHGGKIRQSDFRMVIGNKSSIFSGESKI